MPNTVAMLIAQLSDTHIDLSRPAKAEAMQRAVSHLTQLPLAPDAVIVSGDCTDHGTPEEYALFTELLAPLPMPVYTVPGNHDDREALNRAVGVQGTAALDNFMQYVAEVGPLKLIALDTQIPGESGGLLCHKRLDWLRVQLSEEPGRPTLIFMHHPPLDCGIQVMDQIGLQNREAFEEIIRQHPQVGRVVAGHTHMSSTQNFAGTTLMICGGTDFSLVPDLSQHSKFVVQQQPATCLLHRWTPQTGWLTYTSIIGHYPLTTLHDGQQWN